MPRLGLLTLAALLLLPACRGTLTVAGYTSADDDDASDDDTSDPNDRDGDGDPVDTDCDDEDPSAFHGNDEICGDGVDNDCTPETLCYEATAGSLSAFFEPITTPRSAAQWYSDDGTPPITAVDTMTLALHRQDGQRDLSLVFVIDAPQDATPGRASVSVDGVSGAELIITDDPGEGFLSGDVASFDFTWVECCVDGAVIGPLPADLCVGVEVTDAQNLDSFDIADRSGTQSLGPITQRLELCATQ